MNDEINDSSNSFQKPVDLAQDRDPNNNTEIDGIRSHEINRAQRLLVESSESRAGWRRDRERQWEGPATRMPEWYGDGVKEYYEAAYAVEERNDHGERIYRPAMTIDRTFYSMFKLSFSTLEEAQEVAERAMEYLAGTSSSEEWFQKQYDPVTRYWKTKETEPPAV